MNTTAVRNNVLEFSFCLMTNEFTIALLLDAGSKPQFASTTGTVELGVEHLTWEANYADGFRVA
jgi:hypothetical protein